MTIAISISKIKIVIFIFYRMVQPSSVFVGRSYPNNSNNNNVTFNRTYNELARAQSPLFWQVSGPQQFGHVWEEQYKVCNFIEISFVNYVVYNFDLLFTII